MTRTITAGKIDLPSGRKVAERDLLKPLSGVTLSTAQGWVGESPHPQTPPARTPGTPDNERG